MSSFPFPYYVYLFLPQVFSFCVSTYAVRWLLMTVSTKIANNTKEYEGTSTLAKNTYNYNQKHAKGEEVSVHCISLRPIVCEDRNLFCA
jgi:hypothetical protein